MKKIKKAVLPVAGFGTRFLPATKAIPKEMLAIIDKPLIQYAVEEAVSVGAEEIIFITSHTKDAIENHFSSYPELEERLRSSNKLDLLDKLKPSYIEDLKFSYVNQEEQKGLGHAISLAKDLVGDEPFSVLLPDDLFISSPSCLQQLASSYNEHGNTTIAVNVIDKKNIHKYGVIDPGDNKLINNEVNISNIVEKPSAEDAPSDIAVCGRYIFNPSIFKFIETVKPDSSGEIQITDAIQLLLEKENAKAKVYDGIKFDCGTKVGYVEATIAMGMKDPEISDNIKKIIRELI
jgi:UTP--glucose-1-phosphate uridylyltransferase